MLVDYYSDDFGDPGDVEGNWDNDKASSFLGIQSSGFCWNHVDVGGGVSVAGDDEDYFTWPFRMPEDLNGQYYIVLAADAFASIEESKEDNNYLFFTADENNTPITFVNGEAMNVNDGSRVTAKARKIVRPKQNDPSPCQTMVTEKNLNAYSTEEISAMLNLEKKTGRLKAKALAWQKSPQAKVVMAKAKQINR